MSNMSDNLKAKYLLLGYPEKYMYCSACRWSRADFFKKVSIIGYTTRYCEILAHTYDDKDKAKVEDNWCCDDWYCEEEDR